MTVRFIPAPRLQQGVLVQQGDCCRVVVRRHGDDGLPFQTVNDVDGAHVDAVAADDLGHARQRPGPVG